MSVGLPAEKTGILIVNPAHVFFLGMVTVFDLLTTTAPPDKKPLGGFFGWTARTRRIRSIFSSYKPKCPRASRKAENHWSNTDPPRGLKRSLVDTELFPVLRRSNAATPHARRHRAHRQFAMHTTHGVHHEHTMLLCLRASCVCDARETHVHRMSAAAGQRERYTATSLRSNAGSNNNNNNNSSNNNNNSNKT